MSCAIIYVYSFASIRHDVFGFIALIKVCHYQLILKSVLFYTPMDYGALVIEMLLMMSGDIESNPGPREYLIYYYS